MPTPSQHVPLRRRYGHYSHVPQASAACQPPGVMPQLPRAVAETIKYSHQRLEEHGHALR